METQNCKCIYAMHPRDRSMSWTCCITGASCSFEVPESAKCLWGHNADIRFKACQMDNKSLFGFGSNKNDMKDKGDKK